MSRPIQDKERIRDRAEKMERRIKRRAKIARRRIEIGTLAF